FWREAISGDRNGEADLEQAIALIRKHDAVNATRERARHYAQRAIDAIAAFPASAATAAMTEAAEFAVARRF
ncbi:octaprenyl-diphosphate synthase, partial [Acinetobacter baumannii]